MKLANAKYMLQVDVQYEKSKLTIPLNFDTFYEFLELQLISMCDIGVTPCSILPTMSQFRLLRVVWLNSFPGWN